MDLSWTSEQRAFAAEARDWLRENLRLPRPFPSLAGEVAWGRDWQRKLADGRWLGLSWPAEFGGRGASPVEVALFNVEYAGSRAPQPVNRVGLNLAGPTLLAHGTPEQQRRWLLPLLRADEIWCQLFSEPDAGSDLAALTTCAKSDGDGWRLTGQKVWTSYAQFSRWGLCLARTAPDAPKRRGITFFVVDMTAPGVEIRPLTQITGDAEFNEVFLNDVHVAHDAIVGEVNAGWQIAATTLAHERGTAFPFKEQVVLEVMFDEVFRAAVEDGLLGDPALAEALGDAYVDLRLLATANMRTMSRLAKGGEPGAESSWVKLTWTRLTQRLSELAVDLRPVDAARQRQYLWSKAASIAGGTSEIQRDVIAGRLLGLPRY